jgi:Fe-S cluster assembly ATP-binding protein
MNLNSPLLEIKDLQVSINENEILKNLNLTVNKGEIHAIMGPNGSGKSTFSKVLAGHPAYSILGGDIFFKGSSILDLEPEERSHLGIFLAFQYPIEIPGVSNEDFLRLAYNSKQKFYNKPEVDPIEFLTIINEKLKLVNMSPLFLSRNVNEGFSGGEKKRNEILQMILLDSELSILDETDSGLDIDALKIISNGINNFMNPNKSIILITHYQRLLDYINPTYVHVMQNGKIIKTGSAELAKELEDKGYEWLQVNKIKELFYKNKPKIFKTIIIVIVPVYFLILGNLLN